MPLLQVFRDILLLRRGPQDLPHSPSLLVFACALAIAANALTDAVMLADASPVLLLVAAPLPVLFGLLGLYGILGLRKLRHRFVQAGTALVACNAVAALVSLPLAMVMPHAGEDTTTLSPAALLLAPLGLALALWKLAINAHILRHSLDVPFWSAVSLVLVWVLLTLALASLGGSPTLA